MRQSKRKKPNRKQREARRALNAEIFNEGFEKGWELRDRCCSCKAEMTEFLKINIQK